MDTTLPIITRYAGRIIFISFSLLSKNFLLLYHVKFQYSIVIPSKEYKTKSILSYPSVICLPADTVLVFSGFPL